MNGRRSARPGWILMGITLILPACDGSTEPAMVGSISLSPSAVEITLGSDLQLVATVVSETGSVLPGHPVSWSSSHPDVASVTGAGLVTAQAVGSATVTAQSGGKSSSIPITVIPGPCTEATAGSIAIGETTAGMLGASNCSLFFDDRAAGWSLDLSAPMTVQVDLTSQEFWPLLVVTDSRLNPVAWGNFQGERTLRAVVELPAGQHIVWVLAHESEPGGHYELSVNEAHVCTREAARDDITLGETLTGSVGPDHCLFLHHQPAVGFRLNLAESTGLRLDLASTDFDALLVITDVELEVLWWNDDGGDGLNSRLERRIPAGEYIVWVTSIDFSVGSYELSAREVEIELCPTVGALALGEPVHGDLLGSSCVTPEGRHVAPWTLTLPDSTTLRIDLTSTQFDTYLILEDEDGIQLAEDDDGGVGLNSRLFYTAPAGEYRVVVTTFWPGEVGSYQLSAQSLGGAAVEAVLGSSRPGAFGAKWSTLQRRSRTEGAEARGWEGR